MLQTDVEIMVPDTFFLLRMLHLKINVLRELAPNMETLRARCLWLSVREGLSGLIL